MSDDFDPLAKANNRTRATYLASSMKHKHSKEGGEVGVVMLANETLQLATDYEIALWRIEALVKALGQIQATLSMQRADPGHAARQIDRVGGLAHDALARELTPDHPNLGYPVTVGMDGSVRAARWHPDTDPYRGIDGLTRTRTCAHCGRKCGDMAGGSGTVNAWPVCHPNEQGRPDCYRLITTCGHDPHRCQSGCHVDDGEAKW